MGGWEVASRLERHLGRVQCTCGEDEEHGGDESQAKDVEAEQILIEWAEKVVKKLQKPPCDIASDDHGK